MLRTMTRDGRLFPGLAPALGNDLVDSEAGLLYKMVTMVPPSTGPKVGSTPSRRGGSLATETSAQASTKAGAMTAVTLQVQLCVYRRFRHALARIYRVGPQ